MQHSSRCRGVRCTALSKHRNLQAQNLRATSNVHGNMETTFAHLLMRWQAVPVGQVTHGHAALAHRGLPLGSAAQRLPPNPPPHCPKRTVTVASGVAGAGVGPEEMSWR